MSEVPGGPGWWRATDGRWYPPGTHPAARAGWWMASDGQWYPPWSHPAFRTPVPGWPAHPAGPGRPAGVPVPGSGRRAWVLPVVVTSLVLAVVVTLIVTLVVTVANRLPALTAPQLPIPILGTDCSTSTPAAGSATVVKAPVVRAGGPVVVIVPVCLGGKGPYPFVLDTGAAQSLIDSRLASTLGLPTVGSGGTIGGVGCDAQAQTVRESRWSLGSVPLTGQLLISSSVPGFGGTGEPQGLLGSDVLARFGAVRIDYTNQKVTLPGPEGPLVKAAVPGSATAPLPTGLSSGQARTEVAATVAVYRGGGVAIQLRVDFPRSQSGLFTLDTGAALSAVDPVLARAARLRTTGASVTVGSVGCVQSYSQVGSGSWSVGGTPIAAQTLISVSLGAMGIKGLLGSDALSTFGAVVLDYGAGAVFLGVP